MGQRSEIDPQQQAVYSWEGCFAESGRHTLTAPEVRKLVRRCSSRYAVKRPRVVFLPRSAREWSYYQTKGHRLVMNYYQCNPLIVCHEMAHLIVAARHDDEDVEDHGREFMTIYMRLLTDEQVAPRSALEASAREAGLEWIPPR